PGARRRRLTMRQSVRRLRPTAPWIEDAGGGIGLINLSALMLRCRTRLQQVPLWPMMARGCAKSAAMFWQMPCMLSNIDTVLEKSDVQLAEVLDDESVIQECKSQNSKLLTYLCGEAVMEQMISIIVSEPDCALSDKVRYRHPNVCCELLTCDIESLNDALVDGDRHLDRLCEYLQSDLPLNPLTASFVSKVLQLLARRKSKRLLAYWKALPNGKFVAKLVSHTATAAVVDLLLAIVTMRDEEDSTGAVAASASASEISAEASDWLIRSGLVDRLLDALTGSDASEERRYNAADCICSMLAYCREQASQLVQSGHGLLDLLESRQTTDRLLLALLKPDTRAEESLTVASLQVVLALLDDPDFVGSGSGSGGDSEALLAPELDGDRMGAGAAAEAFGSSKQASTSPQQQKQQQHRLSPERLSIVAESAISALLDSNRLAALLELLESPPVSQHAAHARRGRHLNRRLVGPRLLIGRLLLRLVQLLLLQPAATDSSSSSGILSGSVAASLTDTISLADEIALAYPWCSSFLHLVTERCCSSVLNSTPQLRLLLITQLPPQQQQRYLAPPPGAVAPPPSLNLTRPVGSDSFNKSCLSKNDPENDDEIDEIDSGDDDDDADEDAGIGPAFIVSGSARRRQEMQKQQQQQEQEAPFAAFATASLLQLPIGQTSARLSSRLLDLAPLLLLM
uniref:U-box domain-containing protein n=1 Tax=Macrostomum lignano TaxID=282301 RepID=A0A1I8F1R6_9PLAT